MALNQKEEVRAEGEGVGRNKCGGVGLQVSPRGVKGSPDCPPPIAGLSQQSRRLSG